MSDTDGGANSPGPNREKPLIEAECAWCGLVTLNIDELGCAVSEGNDRGLCEFVCPFCARVATKSVGLLEIKALVLAGARILVHAPLEFLETKKGAPVSWDDVLDFRLALGL